MTKPFRPLTHESVAALAAHMGVYELADAGGQVTFIGFAGGRSLFGLRGELQRHLEQDTKTSQFRIEVNTAYLTRYQELLMVHVADFGELPRDNRLAGVPNLGRLSPGGNPWN